MEQPNPGVCGVCVCVVSESSPHAGRPGLCGLDTCV